MDSRARKWITDLLLFSLGSLTILRWGLLDDQRWFWQPGGRVRTWHAEVKVGLRGVTHVCRRCSLSFALGRSESDNVDEVESVFVEGYGWISAAAQTPDAASTFSETCQDPLSTEWCPSLLRLTNIQTIPAVDVDAYACSLSDRPHFSW